MVNGEAAPQDKNTVGRLLTCKELSCTHLGVNSDSAQKFGQLYRARLHVIAESERPRGGPRLCEASVLSADRRAQL